MTPNRNASTPFTRVLGQALDVYRLVSDVVAHRSVDTHASRAVRVSQRESLMELVMLQDRLESLLAEAGVEPFGPSIGAAVDVRRHRVLGRVESELHVPGTIAELIRPGHELEGGSLVEPALVTVYVRPLDSGASSVVTKNGTQTTTREPGARS